VLSAQRLVALRRQKRIRFADVGRLRCVLEKAKPFIVTQDYRPAQATRESLVLRQQLSEAPQQMGLW
jgi:predicted DNA-binding helix-hairpin-helix protein